MAANAPKKRRGSGNAGSPANGFTEMKDLITQMESFIKEAEALAAMEIRRVEEIKESLKASSTRLVALFREKEASLLTQERTTRELEENLAARIGDLEKQLRDKESLPLAREETLKAAEVKAAAHPPPRFGAAQPSEGEPSIKLPVREPEARSTKGDRREAESTSPRLLSLLGPIKRKS